MQGRLLSSGQVAIEVVRPSMPIAQTWADIVRQGFPHANLPAEIRAWRRHNLPHLWRGLWREQIARMLNLAHLSGQLHVDLTYPDGSELAYGLVSMRVVTTAAMNAFTDALQGSFTISDFKFHGLGTGGASEAVGNTALDTELTTEYATDNVRASGTQTEGDTANVYRTVATNTLDGNATIAEHGIFNQAATGGGTLLDRSVFSAIVVASGIGVKSTYDLTSAAGG